MANKTLSSLVLIGEDKELLSQLLRKAASKSETCNDGPNKREIPKGLINIAEGLVGMMEQSASFPRESLNRVRELVRTVLEQYEAKDLVARIDSLSNGNHLNEGHFDDPKSLSQGSKSQNFLDFSCEGSSCPLKISDSMSKNYEMLKDVKERSYVLGLCLLPEGVMVSKTELFHWCMGLQLEGIDYTDDLANLLESGFVAQIHSTPFNLSKKYKIISPEAKAFFFNRTNQEQWNVSDHYKFKELKQIKDKRTIALMNMNEEIIFDWMLRRLFHNQMQTAKVLLLGRWNWENKERNEERKIIVHDSLKEPFEEARNVRYVSLRGVFKLVKLSESISNLQELLILDLRECHNLVSLPTEIKHLRKLTHLDLSGCYVLEYIPKEISDLVSLKVLKGFIIQADDPTETRRRRPSKVGEIVKYCKTKTTSPCSFGIISKCCKLKTTKKVSHSSSCLFSELSKLTKLEKLTIRTRRMGFPTKDDLMSLRKLESLKKLGIAWVGNPNNAHIDSNLDKFPQQIEKLELQCATHQTMSTLLELIERSNQSKLNKLYIKGGGIRHLTSCLPTIKTLRLRYLSHFDIEWDEFKPKFPTLLRLEVFKCPGLVWFPFDQNGIWENVQ